MRLDDDLLDYRQAARFLGVSATTVSTLVKDPESGLRPIRFSGQKRVKLSARNLREYVQAAYPGAPIVES